MEYRAPIFQKEFDRGVAAGIAEAKAERITKGMANALVLVLTSKFGPLPDHDIDQITTANQDQLERWLVNTVDKHTLDQILS